MGTLVDVIDQVIHDESFGRLDLSIFVLPGLTLSNVYDSTPLSLDRCAHGYLFERIQVDLDILVLNAFGAYYHVDVEV